jgi:SOUL heme-binding protein
MGSKSCGLSLMNWRRNDGLAIPAIPMLLAGVVCSMKRTLIITSILGIGTLLVACKATRAGYNSAAYTTTLRSEAFEIRDYPELNLVSTQCAEGKDREDDGQFMRLFGYITGKNSESKKIAMTTPVFMDEMAGATRMSFVLPADINQANAPSPNSDQVKLSMSPPRKMAVLRYAGRRGAAAEAVQLVRLRAWIASQKLEITGEPVAAYYDPPFMPSPLRRNEVMLPVR